MDGFVRIVEKWLKKVIFIQLLFLLAAQILLRFDDITPYLNKAVVSEGVVRHLGSVTETVIEFLSGFRSSGM